MYSGSRECLADLPSGQGVDPSGRWQNFNHSIRHDDDDDDDDDGDNDLYIMLMMAMMIVMVRMMVMVMIRITLCMSFQNWLVRSSQQVSPNIF